MYHSTLLGRSDALITRYHRTASPALRLGLGLTIFLAGGHKLVAPAAWHAYLAPPFATLWPTALLSLNVTFMLFGLSELLFGALILIDWHTPTIAAITGLSLLGVVANLGIGVALGEQVMDVLIRDLGLTVFAFSLAVHAGPRSDGEPNHSAP